MATVDESLSPFERTVAEIWAVELGVKSITAASDFFLLGGDSLKMQNILSRINEQLGLNVPLVLLFEQPTLKGFCALLDSHGEPAIQSAGSSGSEGMF